MLIDIHTFTMLKKMIKKDGWLEMPASGNSMFPFIQEGDKCRFVPCKPSELKQGDVLLYYSQTGKLIAHRYVEMTKEKDKFLLKGDTNLGFDQPIEEHWILGKLVSVQKKRRKIKSEHPLFRIWGRLVISLPILSGILRNYLNKKLKLEF